MCKCFKQLEEVKEIEKISEDILEILIKKDLTIGLSANALAKSLLKIIDHYPKDKKSEQFNNMIKNLQENWELWGNK